MDVSGGLPVTAETGWRLTVCEEACVLSPLSTAVTHSLYSGILVNGKGVLGNAIGPRFKRLY